MTTAEQKNISVAAGAAPRTPGHTPGPWTVEGRHPWVVKCPTVYLGILGVICEAGYRPNARLIAAAPDFRKAADSYIAWIECYGDDLPPGVRAAMESAFGAQIRAAIAKTEG